MNDARARPFARQPLEHLGQRGLGPVALALDALGLGGAMTVSSLPAGEQPYLVAAIQTPRGAITRGGPKGIS